MAGLAVLLKARGHEVDGCDLKSTPRTRWLESCGIPVAIGHDAKHVEGKDLVIVTPAVAKDNPEYVAAEGIPQPQLEDGAEGIPQPQLREGRQLGMRFPNRSVVSRGEVLAALVSAAPESIAVCGSHGKTTTSTFIAKLLIELGESVEWAIGGETGAFPVAGFVNNQNNRMNVDSGIRLFDYSNISHVLVVEADESDGTLALYHAKTLVVTNCEYDHPDHFKTVADYFACYDCARKNAERVIEGSEDVGVDSEELRIMLSDPNARLAVRVALARGHSLDAVAAVLPRVVAELPDRRFQKLAEGVYADYGHHPTEIRYAISRARTLLSTFQPSNRSTVQPCLRILFQPHRYSRTAAFKREFAEALMLADEVVICPVYSAFEKPLEGGDSCDLYAVIREVERKGGGGQRKVFLAKSCEDAWEHARNSMRPGDVTLIQGAGDIINLVPAIKKDLTSIVDLDLQPRPLPCRRILIGAGTNTVKTDLNLSVEYVKTTGPASQLGAKHSALSTLFPWMAGIPGTLGGWVKMNAGAHGHAIGEVIESVKVDGRWISAADCGFAYRHSDITGEIQDVRFVEKRETGSEECPSVEHFLSLRRKFPAHTRGSVFKNPEGDSAGRLLEACGCKGLRVGGAYVWEEHANVIVAPPDSATASDFLALMQIMRNRVFLRKGVELVPEVRI